MTQSGISLTWMAKYSPFISYPSNENLLSASHSTYILLLCDRHTQMAPAAAHCDLCAKIWGLNKMVDILQATFWNTFASTNMLECRIKDHKRLFRSLGVFSRLINRLPRVRLCTVWWSFFLSTLVLAQVFMRVLYGFWSDHRYRDSYPSLGQR